MAMPDDFAWGNGTYTVGLNPHIEFAEVLLWNQAKSLLPSRSFFIDLTNSHETKISFHSTLIQIQSSHQIFPDGDGLRRQLSPARL